MAHKYLSTDIGDLKYAYSFKRVVSGYAGDCIKVRRDSDDTTADIGFSGDDFDSSSLSTFLSGANGFIDTWYDQTGTVDLVQATNADQPSLVEEDGEWTAYFDGSSATMQLANGSALTTATNSSLQIIWKNDLTNDTDVSGFQFGSTDQQIQPKQPGAGAAGGNYLYVQTKTAQEYISNGVWDDGKWRQHQVQFHNGTMECFEFGTDLGPSKSKTNPDMAHFYVGGNDSVAADMYVSEVVWFDAVNWASDVWMVAKNNYSATLFDCTDYILHVGDSLSSGQFPGLNSEWMQVAHESLGTDRWNVRGDAGNTADQWVDEIYRINPHGADRFMSPSSGSRVVVFWAGTNDIKNGSTGAETYAFIVEFAQLAKDAGYGGVIVMTCLPRTETGVITVTHSVERAALNTLLKANTTDFDLVVDLDVNSNLMDETDGTYFQADQVHLTASGASEVGSTFASALTAASFNFSNYLGGNMGITFAVRGDSLDARYSSVGKEGFNPGNSNNAAVTTDAPGINGVNSIDMAGSLGHHPLNFLGGRNGSGNLTRSYIMRVKFGTVTATNSLMYHGCFMGQNLESNGMSAYSNSSGEIVVTIANSVGGQTSYTSSGASLGTSNFHDIVLTYTGTTASNGVEVWVDAVRVLQTTSNRPFAPDPMTLAGQNSMGLLAVGSSIPSFSTQIYVDEFVIEDTIIDPTSVELTSGTGSLNGSSRTAYMEVDEYDGLTASSGGGGSTRTSLGGPGISGIWS